MKNLMIGAMLAATAALPLAVPASAQSYNQPTKAQADLAHQQRQLDDAQARGDRHDIRKQSKDVRQAQRKVDRQQARDWRHDRRGYAGAGGAYYADQHYRDGRGYKERRLGANDRVYRGRDGRYYCKRNDGTTGLIIGGLAGGVLGNVIANGHSSTLATLLGAGGGALVGRSIDRNHDVRCR